LERQLVYIVGTAKSKRRRRALNTAALNTAQHTGPQHSEDRHRTQRLSTQLSTQAAALNTAALNSEDRHRPLHTQAAALKLDLNDINMCLSMSPITGLSTHRSTLKTGTEHSGSQHSSTQRLSTLKIGTGLSTHTFPGDSSIFRVRRT
jgi:hypothetical protein